MCKRGLQRQLPAEFIHRVLEQHVVQRNARAHGRGEIRRRYDHPRRHCLHGSHSAVQLHLRRHGTVRNIVMPAVVIREGVNGRSRRRVGTAEASQNQQAPFGIRSNRAERNFFAHELAGIEMGYLIGTRKRAGAGVDNQLFTIGNPGVAQRRVGCQPIEAVPGRLLVGQVHSPVDLCVGGGNLASHDPAAGETTAERESLFMRPHHHLERMTRAHLGGVECLEDGQRRERAEVAVEIAAIRDGVDM